MTSGTPPILFLLEDDELLLESLSTEFRENGFSVVTANSLSHLEPHPYDFALLDLRLQNGEFGLNAIPLLLKLSPHCRIVILTAYGSVRIAVEALKKGAVDCLLKPANFSEILNALIGETAMPSLKNQEGQETFDWKRPSLSQVEQEYIDFVLSKNDGNISRTAKELGLHRQSLQRKLKKYPQ